MNKIKFSSTLTIQYPTPFSAFSPDDFEKGLEWLKKSTFDAAEICISNYKGVDVKAVKDKLDSFSLSCSTISTGQARALENISLLHEGHALSVAQERMKQHIDAASILKSKVTLGLLRGLGTYGKEQEEKKILAKNLAPIVDYAESKGVTIILECINRYETALFNDAASTVDFIKKELADSPCMGILWDIFHANIEDPTFAYAIEVMGDKLKHVHVADSNRMFPGYGHTDFAAIVTLLKEVGFKEYMSFECFNKPSLDIVLSKSSEFINKMREI